MICDMCTCFTCDVSLSFKQVSGSKRGKSSSTSRNARMHLWWKGVGGAYLQNLCVLVAWKALVAVLPTWALKHCLRPKFSAGVMQRSLQHSLVCLGIGTSIPRLHQMYRKASSARSLRDRFDYFCRCFCVSREEDGLGVVSLLPECGRSVGKGPWWTTTGQGRSNTGPQRMCRTLSCRIAVEVHKAFRSGWLSHHVFEAGQSPWLWRPSAVNAWAKSDYVWMWNSYEWLWWCAGVWLESVVQKVSAWPQWRDLADCSHLHCLASFSMGAQHSFSELWKGCFAGTQQVVPFLGRLPLFSAHLQKWSLNKLHCVGKAGTGHQSHGSWKSRNWQEHLVEFVDWLLQIPIRPLFWSWKNSQIEGCHHAKQCYLHWHTRTRRSGAAKQDCERHHSSLEGRWKIQADFGDWRTLLQNPRGWFHNYEACAGRSTCHISKSVRYHLQPDSGKWVWKVAVQRRFCQLPEACLGSPAENHISNYLTEVWPSSWWSWEFCEGISRSGSVACEVTDGWDHAIWCARSGESWFSASSWRVSNSHQRRGKTGRGIPKESSLGVGGL